MKKRLFSILIVLVMVMCLAPTTVFAQTYTCKNHIIPRSVKESDQKYTYKDEQYHNVIHDAKVLGIYCGATIAQEVHTGGTATCTSKAVCEKCGQEYGEYKHSGELKYVDLGNGTHQRQWSCCNTPVGDAEAHDWANAEGKCTKCQATHIHSGGKAICTSGAICETCEYEYTDADPTNHTGKREWVIDNDTHELKYNCCNKEVVPKAAHTGGTATCTEKKICEICKEEYGNTDPTIHSSTEKKWVSVDATTHKQVWSCCGAETGETGTHNWNAEGVCSDCGYPCEHTNKEYVDITATTHTEKCKDCGYVIAEEELHAWEDGHCTKCEYECEHTDTTCTDIDAYTHNEVCDTCDIELVKSEPHDWKNKDGVCADCGYECENTTDIICTDNEDGKTHTITCNVCGETLDTSDPHDWSNKDGVCADCGYECENTTDIICTDNGDGKTHTITCNVCGETLDTSEPHDWSNKDGVCVDCNYQCQHKDENEDHYCDICGMHTNHTLRHENAEPATTTTYGNKEYWVCTGCGKFFSDENAANEIKQSDTVTDKLAITSGNGSTVTAGEKKELTFTSTAEFKYFIRVELDGKTVDGSNYTVAEGSTIVTLKADYVASLAEGKHTLGIVSEGGTATAEFTVTKKATSATTVNAKTNTTTVKAETTGTTNSAKTGDNSNLGLWITLLCVSGGAVTATTIVNRRKKCNR